MSSEQDQVRQLAERIARRVAQGKNGTTTRQTPSGHLNDELAAMRRSLSELQQRLVKIESHLTQEDNPSLRERQSESQNFQPTGTQRLSETEARAAARSPFLSGVYVPVTHPSQERFGVEEAAVSELVDFFEGAKTCEMEPGGKPCDHCAMCSSRGF